jgi:UDPglucose--hexose-1-phosphate uridylyltransferase
MTDRPHRRYNPLTREWVLVSPHRLERPWQGHVERPPAAELPAYDPGCYLCPGNIRASGARNPAYQSTFVFENDFAALEPDSPQDAADEDALLMARGEPGICRVVCYSPRHDLSLAQMSVEQVRAVVDLWAEQYQSLGAKEFIRHVQIFENRGEMMGCSNPHSHGQIWAQLSLPEQTVREQESQSAYRTSYGECLLCNYAAVELRKRIRLVARVGAFVAVVPFWAVWPFETLLLSERHYASIEQLPSKERDDLAALLVKLTTAYDRLFGVPFPYTMGFHQRPTDGERHEEWHLHAHFYPPLLRSASVRKFMVGYEMLGDPQRDLTAESAAARLREVV